MHLPQPFSEPLPGAQNPLRCHPHNCLHYISFSMMHCQFTTPIYYVFMYEQGLTCSRPSITSLISLMLHTQQVQHINHYISPPPVNGQNLLLSWLASISNLSPTFSSREPIMSAVLWHSMAYYAFSLQHKQEMDKLLLTSGSERHWLNDVCMCKHTQPGDAFLRPFLSEIVAGIFS